MPRRQRKKAVPVGKRPAPAAELRRALLRRSKAELVDVLLELAQADRAVLRQLTARFALAATADELVAAARQAIADAAAASEAPDAEAAEIESAALRSVRRMVELGFLNIDA